MTDLVAARRSRLLRTAYLVCDDPLRAEALAEATLAESYDAASAPTTSRAVSGAVNQVTDLASRR